MKFFCPNCGKQHISLECKKHHRPCAVQYEDFDEKMSIETLFAQFNDDRVIQNGMIMSYQKKHIEQMKRIGMLEHNEQGLLHKLDHPLWSSIWMNVVQKM